MKQLMLALGLLSAFNAFASTVDGYSLPITGIQTEENFTLNAVQTRTEYRNETVARTCFRTVFDGYQTVCRQEPETYCYEDHMSRRICSTRYVNRCSSEARYRQEAYTCYQTISVPYEVPSNNVKANVKVKVTNTPGVLAPHNSCNLNSTLEGSSFRVNASCSEFIVLAKQSADESRVGDTVIQNRVLDLTLIDAKKLTAPVKGGIGEMRLEGQTLVLRTGDLTKNSNFSLKLFVERRKLLGSDDTLINRNLAPSEYSFEKTGEDFGLVKINLSSLVGGINTKKKHVIRVNLNVAADLTGALNTSLPSLSAEESITVND
ncbi:hypothetical protein DOM21_01615 [Bacteriovorax stolpii]|uniref:Uncharacterized protein n=1 Tax=Bacteriovorax stolpii TaxID=960 RepID=A0A2K9NWE6_BACTC|nr:hypothetical protein [Bacteriovorax stolpii]AUN99831.1 hypothetical protein C0V70_17315 [Bacteriovorax stolpii]QDK40176.1 hypothetical protein DOM21_01615 [Bacteriovorax stolpii]TDP54278.1 hypothetical protein C8D79_1572 [Bacteriovorax stolpii]